MEKHVRSCLGWILVLAIITGNAFFSGWLFECTVASAKESLGRHDFRHCLVQVRFITPNYKEAVIPRRAFWLVNSIDVTAKGST